MRYDASQISFKFSCYSCNHHFVLLWIGRLVPWKIMTFLIIMIKKLWANKIIIPYSYESIMPEDINRFAKL
jgi:hypothetical protein